MERVCPSCGTPVSGAPPRVEEIERPGIEEAILGDGITLRDYYDLRDLRLLLWNLESELAKKYGIVEALPLASELRSVIERKIEEIRRKIR
jgi:hypothetical protein